MKINKLYQEEVMKQIRQVTKENDIYKVSTCLYVIFKYCELIYISEDAPNKMKVKTLSGREYSCNVAAVYNLLSGYYSLYFEERKAEYSIDFDFKKLPRYISFLIKTYRKLIKKYGINYLILLQDENLKGILCMQDYLVTWLLDHNYLVDYYIYDNNENLYIQEKITNCVKESKYGKKKK